MITRKYTSIIRIIITIVLIQGCRNQNKGKLQLPVDLKVVNLNRSIKMEDVLSKKIKVVAFFKLDFALKRVLPSYRIFIEKYDNIGFVFYINYKDKKGLKEHLKKIGISYPVFYDPIDTFLKSNTSAVEQRMKFMGFIINSHNEILEVTNPSIPGFRKKLSQYNQDIPSD